MENLVNKEDIMQAANLKKFGADRVATLIMKTLRLERVNSVYQKAQSSSSLEFIDKVFAELNIKFEVSEKDLANIPKTGAFITVSNHPYGGIDGLILLRILSQERSDYKLMANFLLQKVVPLKSQFVSVNPFDSDISAKSSLKGIKQTLKHLSEGAPLGIFPAGEVSSIHNGSVTDKQWNDSVIKLIKKAEVPVIPIFFSGGNSIFFHLLGLINPKLRTIKLPSELLNKKNKTIEVRIGKPISVKEQSQFEDNEKFGRYLRSKTYAQGSAIEVKRFFRNGLKKNPHQEEIISATDIHSIIAEIEYLKRDHFLFHSSNYEVYCAPSEIIPNTLQEIGRLREITYREVGEGTNHACDLDEFDLYYQHLIIWDAEAKAIVGGYRIGKGAEIMRGYGIRGFYLHELFKIKKPIWPIFSQSLELGRSFIVKAYQRKPLPLFLLWKGILVFLLKNPGYRYLTGPVSISNQFSGFSKGILIEFLKRDFYNNELAEHIKPRKKFKIDASLVDVDILLESSQKDLAKLDKIIQEIEPMGLNLPVLFKKYIKQNAKVIGFNTDPKFNNALDGFMLLDIYDMPQETLKSLMKELENPDLDAALKARNLV
ncbi:MAG: lysophospholipid acyltransferase family protein [Salibacteraceae bacterium]|nr:lysophospholipid acyltransferase family protein [Salibacteraceae bacterium]